MKIFVVFLFISWVLGLISPFIGLSEYQGLFFAMPAGWGMGLSALGWKDGDFDK